MQPINLDNRQHSAEFAVSKTSKTGNTFQKRVSLLSDYIFYSTVD